MVLSPKTDEKRVKSSTKALHNFAKSSSANPSKCPVGGVHCSMQTSTAGSGVNSLKVKVHVPHRKIQQIRKRLL